MKKAALIPFLLFALTSPSVAADWHYIGFTGSGDSQATFFVDQDIIGNKSYGPRKTWVYKILKKLDSDGVRKSKTLWSFNCSEKTITLIAYVDVGNNDVVMSSGDFKTYEQKSHYVAPDTIGESEWRFVCASYPDAIRLGSMAPEQFAATIFRIGTK